MSLATGCLVNERLISWSSTISKYVQNGQAALALKSFEDMEAEGIRPDRIVYSSVLKACMITRVIKYAMGIHDQIVKNGFHMDSSVGSSLIVMYAKLGCLKESCNIFDRMPDRNVVLWGAMMTGYTENGFGQQALALYEGMQERGIKPDRVIFLCLLKACSSVEAAKSGKILHDEIIRGGLEHDVALASTLLDMYAKCAYLKDAEAVFSTMPWRNVVSWNALMVGHVQQGNCLTALHIFKDMQQSGVTPSKVTFLCIMKACGNIKAIGLGEEMHNQLIFTGLEMNLDIGNALIDMYAKCQKLEEARKVFDSLVVRDHVSWGAMISGYVQLGNAELAIKLFEDMQRCGIEPDKASFSSILKACGAIGDMAKGKLMHNQVKKMGYECDTIIGNTLIDMYSKCGCLKEAREAFENLVSRTEVSWGAMIAGYTQHGQGIAALEIFHRMQKEGFIPSPTIFPCVLKACGNVCSLEDGHRIHDKILRTGTKIDVIIGNALIDMYTKCESVEDAIQVFGALQVRDIISWSTMIAGYVQDGQTLHALNLFKRLHKESIMPDRVMILCVLKACSSIGALEIGILLHHWILEKNLESDLTVGNTVLDMYTKCKSLDEAQNVFFKLAGKNVVSWNAMITGYAQLGYSRLALHCFEDMVCQAMRPDSWTFSSVITACSEAALVEEGYWYFRSMIRDHGLRPGVEHFNCMVDLLGRAGCLFEARNLPQTMPFLPDVTTWMSLMTSCRIYGNLDLGRECANEISQLEHDSASVYTLLSHLFGEFSMSDDVDHIQGLKRCSSSWKKPGKACIEVGDVVYEFIVADTTLNKNSDMQRKHQRLTRHLKEQGHSPKLELVLEVSSSEKNPWD